MAVLSSLFLIINGEYLSISKYIRSSEIYSILKRNFILIFLATVIGFFFNFSVSDFHVYLLFWINISFLNIFGRFSLKEILTYSFDEFKKKQFDKIYEKINESKEKIKLAFNFIKTLNPIPSGGTEDLSHTEFLIPDFIIKKDEKEFIVEFTSLNREVNINRSYITMYDELSKRKEMDSESKDSYDFIKNKIQSAKWFIEALNQRNSTLKKTMKAIIDYQKKFFTDGDENDLKPMILKDISEIIEMDISTVSRIVSSKVVQTDFGVFPLKYFFSESKIKKGEEYVSSKVVKNFLKGVIDSEDKKNPLPDELLEKILKKEGFNVARRTIAKYREQLNIPVARLRKSF